MKIIIKIRIFPQYIWLRMAKLSWQFWYFLHLKFIEKSRNFVFQSTYYKCNKVTHENITFVILIFTLTYTIIRSIFDSIYFHWTVKLCCFFFLIFSLFKTSWKIQVNLKKNKICFRKIIFFNVLWLCTLFFKYIFQIVCK